MRILVASNKAAAIQKPVTQNALKNMQFDFQPDCLKLIDMLETQEFSMYDQLVLILSSLDQWDAVQRKTILTRYLAWAKGQPASKEIIFIDSSREFYMDIVTEIQGQSNIHYIDKKIRVTDLPKICAGTYRATDAVPQELAKDTSRRQAVQAPSVPKPHKGGFGLFGKNKKNQKPAQQQPAQPPVQQPQPPVQPPMQQPMPGPVQEKPPVQAPTGASQPSMSEPWAAPEQPTPGTGAPSPQPVQTQQDMSEFDVPLFGDFNPPQKSEQPASSDFGLDLDLDVGEPAVRQQTQPAQQDRFDINNVDDVPVFQPEPQPTPALAPEPVPTYQPEPQPAQQPAPAPMNGPAGNAQFGAGQPMGNPQQMNPAMGNPQQMNPAMGVQQPMQMQPAPAPTQMQTRRPSRAPQTRQNNGAAFRRSIAVLVTGDRRSGVSSVCSNLAVAAAMMGEAVLVLDFDFLRRGQSINFPIQHDENDARYLTPLANALRMPHSLDQYAVNYIDGLDYLGTSLVVSDIEAAQSTVDNAKIQRLLGTALSKYDMVFIDCPFDKIMEWDALVTGATRIIHVMNNDMNAIMNNINLLCEDAFLDPSIYQMYIPRMGIVLNAVKPINVMGIPASAQNLLSLFMGITGDEDSYTDFAVLGEIPFFMDYEKIVASDTQIAETQYGQYYQQLLQLLREV